MSLSRHVQPITCRVGIMSSVLVIIRILAQGCDEGLTCSRVPPSARRASGPAARASPSSRPWRTLVEQGGELGSVVHSLVPVAVVHEEMDLFRPLSHLSDLREPLLE